MRFSFRGLILLLLVLWGVGCDDPDNLGLSVLPNSDQINVFSTDTLSLESYTVEVDSLLGNNTSLSMLGAYSDPVFGSVLAQHYVQFRLSNPNVDFGGIMNCDSIFLQVEIADFYGNENTRQTISAYEIDNGFKVDSLYYTNQNFSASTFRGSQLIKINPDDSVPSGDTKIAPSIKVKLDNSFGDYLMTLPSTAYSSSDEFVEVFKGLFVTANEIDINNKGGLIGLNYGSGISGIILHYSDTLTYEYNVTSASARHTTFKHDYNLSTPVGMQLNNPNLGTERVYIHSTAGLKTRINIPYLSTLKTIGPIAINQAEVTLPIEENSDLIYAPHERLALIASDSIGVDITIPDILESSSYYGGEYDEVNKEYKFNISRHIQQIVNGNREDFGLVLVASGAVVNGRRTILKGANPVGGSGMKINIIYSLVD